MHCVRWADARAAWMAGKSSAIKMPIMAITTNNSTRVNPLRAERTTTRREKDLFWRMVSMLNQCTFASMSHLKTRIQVTATQPSVKIGVTQDRKNQSLASASGGSNRPLSLPGVDWFVHHLSA
jgi:hypothetical protein